MTTLKKMRRTQFFSLRLRLQLALLPSSRGFAIWLLLISLIVATRTPSHAQGYPAGQPIVGNSINVLASSPLYLDVKQLSGADFCAQSTTAFAQTTPPSLIFNGIGESNGTTGTVPCATNPFFSVSSALALSPVGEWDLPSAQILAQTGWTMPPATNGLRIIGTGRGGSASNNSSMLVNETLFRCVTVQNEDMTIS